MTQIHTKLKPILFHIEWDFIETDELCLNSSTAAVMIAGLSLARLLGEA